jgi:polyketide synthase PksJ
MKGTEIYQRRSDAILDVVSKNHGIEIYEICLVPVGTIPKTGSGKVQRKLCLTAYLNRELAVLHQYRQGSDSVKTEVVASCVNSSYTYSRVLEI